MDPNRLPLNLKFQRTPSYNAGQNSESDQTYPATDGGVYPTTPSTFPQPVFQSMHPGQQQQQDYLNANAQMQSQTANTYAGNAQGTSNLSIPRKRTLPGQSTPTTRTQVWLISSRTKT